LRPCITGHRRERAGHWDGAAWAACSRSCSRYLRSFS
jgi:hypothetical protein